MRRFAIAASVLMGAAAPAAAAPCGAEHEAALRHAKLSTWPSFYHNQDAAGLAGFLTDDFVQVGSDGRATARADEIAWVAANPWRPRDFAYSIARIDCPAPDVAVVIGAGRSVWAVEGGAVVHSYASSNLFVRDRGRWRAALSHLSGERSEPLPR